MNKKNSVDINDEFDKSIAEIFIIQMVKNLKINLNIIYGKNSLQNLTSIIKDLGYKNIILICDNKIRNFKYLKSNINFIKKVFLLLMRNLLTNNLTKK